MRVALEQHGDGDPLVLIHGLATTRIIWRRVLPLLTPGRRVVTLDVPGFGASPPAGPGFVLEEVAARVAAALETEGLGADAPFDLVGHSMGGAVALTLAERHPGAVRRLVLVAPAGLRSLPRPVARVSGLLAGPLVTVRRQGAILADVPWGRRLLISPGTADPAAMPPAEVRAMLAASRGAQRIPAALATVAAADLRPTLRALGVPVGVIWGAADRIIPVAGVDTVLQERPGAPVVRIARAGHIPMMERPTAFADALDTVLAALSAGTPTARTAARQQNGDTRP